MQPMFDISYYRPFATSLADTPGSVSFKLDIVQPFLKNAYHGLNRVKAGLKDLLFRGDSKRAGNVLGDPPYRIKVEVDLSPGQKEEYSDQVRKS